MKFIKKLISKKYFFMIFFFILLLLLATLLHLTIQHDIWNNQPHDGMVRAEATVTTPPAHAQINKNGVSKDCYYDIQVRVKLSENESHTVPLQDPVPVEDVGSLSIDSKLTVKYAENNPDVFYYADDPQPHYRVVLYVIYGILILASIGGILASSRIMDVKMHRKRMAENMENVKKTNEANNPEMTGSAGDINLFGDSSIDYNAIYAHEQSLNDAAYSAEGTYSGYDSEAAPSSDPFGNTSFGSGNDPFGGNSSDAEITPSSEQAAGSPQQPVIKPVDSPLSPPTAPRKHRSKRSASVQAPAPKTTSATPTAPEPTVAKPTAPPPEPPIYGAPNPSMDTAYDPTAPYTGYGAPNPSMDAPYDPFAPYTGYDN